MEKIKLYPTHTCEWCGNRAPQYYDDFNGEWLCKYCAKEREEKTKEEDENEIKN